MGEVIDTVSTLEIKQDRLHDAGKLINIRAELAGLRKALVDEGIHGPELGSLTADPLHIKTVLWDIEDKFVSLSVKIYFTRAFSKLRGMFAAVMTSIRASNATSTI